eukprot:TRINITY_DN10784_c0_g1_i1.p1 TRINITY_DN10784_c0_g1~~TRINITY_DN10784_c0_g1_i1.p1  ORF type:complete len:330 (-),score=75.94 TRINITY_DN10784_c0_g1_i1:25-1014(-)
MNMEDMFATILNEGNWLNEYMVSIPLEDTFPDLKPEIVKKYLRNAGFRKSMYSDDYEEKDIYWYRWINVETGWPLFYKGVEPTGLCLYRSGPTREDSRPIYFSVETFDGVEYDYERYSNYLYILKKNGTAPNQEVRRPRDMVPINPDTIPTSINHLNLLQANARESDIVDDVKSNSIKTEARLKIDDQAVSKYNSHAYNGNAFYMDSDAKTNYMGTAPTKIKYDNSSYNQFYFNQGYNDMYVYDMDTTSNQLVQSSLDTYRKQYEDLIGSNVASELSVYHVNCLKKDPNVEANEDLPLAGILNQSDDVGILPSISSILDSHMDIEVEDI